MADERNDDDLEDGEMRSLFASMRETDEEPPVNGMAALMAAARVKAEEMRPQPTWWERLAGLMRSPVMAFAGVAILIGGAIVVTRHQDQAPKSEVSTTSSSEDRAPAPVSVPSATPSLPDPAPMDLAEEKSPTTAPASRIESTRELSRPKMEPTAERPRATKAPAPLETMAADEGAPAPAAPKSPTVQGAPTPRVTGAAQGESNQQASTSAQLVKRCEVAAANNDCIMVRKLAAELAKQDPATYTAKLQKNANVQRCLAAPNERPASP